MEKKDGVYMKIKRVLSVVKYLLLIAALIAIFIEADIVTFGRKAKPSKANCIIVLGCQVFGTNPSPFLQTRLNEGLRLYNEGYGEYIIVSGGKGPGEDVTEAEAMKKYLVDKGVESKNIFIEDKSNSTMENLVLSKEIMDKNKLKDAVIVSNKYHLRRVSLMAKRISIDASYSGVFVKQYKFLEYKGHLREAMALVKYLIIKK